MPSTELGNVLVGDAAANTLDGGSGNDAMSGGAGDDAYLVEAAGDVITELSAGAGVPDAYSVGRRTEIRSEQPEQ